MRRLTLTMSAAILALAVPAWAETPAPKPAEKPMTIAATMPIHVRGKIKSVDGNKITVDTREGTVFTAEMADNWAVLSVKPLSADAIKAGSYIGTAEIEEGEGKGRSLEVLVFPEAMRGAGEGHYGWDLAPGSTMTNGTVGQVTEGSKGRELEVNFQGNKRQITVPANVPIVTFQPDERAAAVPGAAVFITVPKAANGGYDKASRIVIGKDGAVPPM